MARTGTGADRPERTVALTQELSDFLIELSIALHRHAMYPAGHPSLEPAAEGVVNRLIALFANRGSVSLGVARRQLVIEGVATDPKHPVLRDLSGRLHRHHIGAIRFEPGVEVDEVAHFLRTIAVDADRADQPLGLGATETLQQWAHVRAYPLTYGQLELVENEREGARKEDGSSARAARLWIGLARAALNVPADADVDTSEPAAVAAAINAHERAEAYDQVIVGYLLQIAEELKTEGGASAAALRRRISSVVKDLDSETLERLVQMSGDYTQRQQFVTDAAKVFAVDAVVDLVSAAASASGQSISDSMLRLLSKLAAHAGHGTPIGRQRADSELREHVQRLVRNWSLEDPNPEAYTHTLLSMARAAPVQGEGDAGDRDQTSGERMVLMALELDVFGEPVARAIDDMVEAGQLFELLRLLERASHNQATDAMWERIARPDVLRDQLEGETGMDAQALRPLAARLGTDAIPVLLDAMEVSESRSVRRLAIDMLSDFGEPAGRMAAERLARPDEPWYVQRNLLGLLAETGHWPSSLESGPFLKHGDARVRREAYRALLEVPAERDRAACSALQDPDTRNLRQGLAAARERLPLGAVPILLRRLEDDDLPTELRVAAIQALGGAAEPLARDALLERVVAGRGLFGGLRLAAPSPETVAALGVLHSTWQRDAAAAAVLQAARESRDPRIRAAVGGEKP